MGEWGERKKTHLLCFLVSVLGVVGADPVGQVVGRVYGGGWVMMMVVVVIVVRGGGCGCGVREHGVVVVSQGGGSWGEDMQGSTFSRDRKKVK
jgi:Na+/citrate or Na+/malate symporter